MLIRIIWKALAHFLIDTICKDSWNNCSEELSVFSNIKKNKCSDRTDRPTNQLTNLIHSGGLFAPLERWLYIVHVQSSVPFSFYQLRQFHVALIILTCVALPSRPGSCYSSGLPRETISVLAHSSSKHATVKGTDHIFETLNLCAEPKTENG